MTHKFFIFVLLVLVGCGANALPTPTRISVSPVPTVSPDSPPTLVLPTLGRTPTRLANEALLQIFPLRQGAQWVYREDAYDTIPNEALPERKERQITATLAVTDTVVETQTHGDLYAAQVVRLRSIITTSLDLSLLGEGHEDYFANNASATTWYIFQRDRIVSQSDRLDWDALADAQVEYKLPFVIGECWYPEPSTIFDCTGKDPQGTIPGYRLIHPLDPQRVPAGSFSPCYLIRDVYNGGNPLQRFCEGVGIVGQDFDHAGTPFGSHSTLLQFIPGR